MTPAEHSYRRMLRLLPAGFRRDWEEDMVNAYIERSESSRPMVGERLSIVALAIRTRLNGTHASPRGRVLDQAVHGLALTALLFQALDGVARLNVPVYLWARHIGDSPTNISHPELQRWYPGLLWVGAFIALAMRRVVVARVLTVLGALSAVGMAIATLTGPVAFGYGFPNPDIAGWAWLAVNVVIVLLAPRDARTATGWWIGGFLAGWALALATLFLAWDSYGLVERSTFTEVLSNLYEPVSHVAVLVGMVVALARRNAGWLLALGLIGGGTGAARLRELWFMRAPGDSYLWPASMEFIFWLDIARVALAVVCGIAGLMMLLRLPRESSPAAPAGSKS